MKVYGVTLDEKTREKMKKVAEENNRSLSGEIRQAIKEHLEKESVEK